MTGVWGQKIVTTMTTGDWYCAGFSGSGFFLYFRNHRNKLALCMTSSKSAVWINIFSPIIAAGTLVNWAVRMQRGSCCPLATLEEPISSERVKPQRVKLQTHSRWLLSVKVCVCFMPWQVDYLWKKHSHQPGSVITSRTCGMLLSSDISHMAFLNSSSVLATTEYRTSILFEWQANCFCSSKFSSVKYLKWMLNAWSDS